MATTTPVLPFERPGPLDTPPEYARLRASTPVARVTTADGQPAWLVTSYAAAAAALADPRLRTMPPGVTPAAGEPVWDGPPHLRLRRLVGKAFTPRKVEAMRPRIEELAREHADAFAAAGPPADLVARFAAPFSSAVIGELLGVPAEDRDRFRAVADAAWDPSGSYAAELVASKRERLGDDLLSDLITVHDADDGRLDDAELVLLVTVVVAAGHQTATNGISVGTLQLLTTDSLAPLAADSDADATVGELLRLQIGLIGEPLPRWAHEDVELGGVTIAKGDQVLVRLEAANRDPDRPAGARLTFGRGPHHCLGAALAQVEVSAALRALAERLPHLRLAGPVEEVTWTHNYADAGPTAVRVTW